MRTTLQACLVMNGARPHTLSPQRLMVHLWDQLMLMGRSRMQRTAPMQRILTQRCKQEKVAGVVVKVRARAVTMKAAD